LDVHYLPKQRSCAALVQGRGWVFIDRVGSVPGTDQFRGMMAVLTQVKSWRVCELL
jgi:hypothetical protein